MMDMENPKLIDCDFSLLSFKDGKAEHREGKGPVRFVWGLEATLKRDLRGFYYFEVNRMNVDKRVVPGDATVNGIKAETIGRGEYLIPRDAVKEPFEIRVESIPALCVKDRSGAAYPVLGLPGEKVHMSFDSFRMGQYRKGKNRPVFAAYRHDDGTPIELAEFEYVDNPTYPWASFLMPECDVDLDISSGQDDSKATLHVDMNGLEGLLVGEMDAIVSEALYSDDYDFGVRDHYFYEGSIVFPKGATLKVEFALNENKTVRCLVNGKVYSPKRCHQNVYQGEGKPLTVYSYRFEIVFESESNLWFEVD